MLFNADIRQKTFVKESRGFSSCEVNSVFSLSMLLSRKKNDPVNKTIYLYTLFSLFRNKDTANEEMRGDFGRAKIGSRVEGVDHNARVRR